jgi:hypothetical protein
MVAPQQIIKKIKVRGLHILHRKLSALQYVSARCRVWGFVFGLCKLSVKIGKTIAKRKNQFGFNFKGNYCSKR